MSVYKHKFGDTAPIEAVSRSNTALAILHAESINLASSVMGRPVHDFNDCKNCLEQSAAYRAIVVLNLKKVEYHVS